MSFKPFNPFSAPPEQKPGAPRFDKKGRPIDPAKERARQIRSFLFKPDLTSGLQDLRETHGLFLRIISNVFLQTGLIDAAYPGIADPKKLSLVSLLRYAGSQLEFTREGMPRVLMYFAFVGSLAAVALSILIFALHLMSAHK